MARLTTTPKLAETYTDALPASRALFERARPLFPDAVTHDERSRALRQALILGGVDFNGARALVSTCHTDAVLDEAVAAFETAIRIMREEGLA